MKERPILFSGEMVKAILAGTKTQTRRVVKFPAKTPLYSESDWMIDCEPIGRCPYGQPGDRLWVREAWSQPTNLDPGPTFYRADYPDCVPDHFENVPPADQIKWKPSIHMRRDQSRILLEIISVRVERLKDISEADAKAEGSYLDRCDCMPRRNDRTLIEVAFRMMECYIHGSEFRHLWETINGPGSWAANPYVWRVEFKRVTP